MVEPYLRRSPLAHFGLRARAASQVGAVQEAEILLGERPHRCQINLRGNPVDPAFIDGVRQATGLNLPRRPTASRPAANCGRSGSGPTSGFSSVPPAARRNWSAACARASPASMRP